MDQEKIGKFIASSRKKKQLTQAMLAEKLGVSDRTIGNWENGRNMPDISLFKPLCEELDISLSELLNGERVKKEEIASKSEEAIYKTFKYTKKKINHVKLIFGIILTIIILIVTTLIVLFGIDINRMKNNKPVFFSTWGLKYAPPINLDYIKVEKTIKDYLIKEVEKNKHYDNEKSFVAMRTYLIEEKKDKYYVYAWVLQKKYYVDNDKVIEDSGSSIPHKFELTKLNDTYEVVNYDIPRDGSYYSRDMKHIFPNSVLRDIDNDNISGTIEKLEFEIMEQVELYFHD